MSDREESEYRAFLLRLWRERGESRDRWRAAVEEVAGGSRQGFADLEGLYEYLRRLTTTGRRPPERNVQCEE